MTAAHAQISQQAENWHTACYEGFAADVDEFVGKDALDCGFVLKTDSRTRFSAARACGRRAQRIGIPFKIGFSGFGTDSAFCRAAIKSPNGQLWEFVVDIDVLDTSGGGSTLWISRCRKLSFSGEKYNPLFSTSQCTEDEAATERVVGKSQD